MTRSDAVDIDMVERSIPSDDPPMVSAVVATRDRPELLRQAVRAIRTQRYSGVLETVVVFDQSEPDWSLAVEDPTRPVVVVTNQRTPGLAGARNSGILAATGELVALCDDDDVWLPEKLRLQVAMLQREPHADMVMAGCVINYDGRRRERVFDGSWLSLDDLIRSRVQDAHPSTIVVRRDALLNRIGLVDEHLPGSYGEDHDWMLRAARSHDIAMVERPLAEIRWSNHSFFADRWRTIIAAIDYMIEKHPEFAREPVGLANLYGRKAFAFAALGQRSDARHWALRSLRSSVLDRRAYVTLLVSTGLISARSVLRIANWFGRGV